MIFFSVKMGKNLHLTPLHYKKKMKGCSVYRSTDLTSLYISIFSKKVQKYLGEWESLVSVHGGCKLILLSPPPFLFFTFL